MYNSNILDSIHGLIKVSEIEKWIFSERPFNRLRRIKQNTFLYLVFPSANHTRFEHSIGVMHLAHQIYNSANENYNTGIFKKEKYNLNPTTDFEFFSTEKNLGEQEEVLIQELRIAALLHDVGHGPMSHLFDHYTINGNNFIKIIENDEELKSYIEGFNNLLKGPDEKIDHEVVSCMFVIKIIVKLKQINLEYPTKFNPKQKSIIDQLDVKRIVQMIEPKFNAQSCLVFNDFDYSNFFSSIISSFPLDADRMDYMVRDSIFAGVNYGSYDKSRLLMSFIPVMSENMVTLAIKESGIDSIIRFIQSRTHLYNQVYFHKTNRAANSMLDFAFKGLKNASVIEASNYKEFEEFYWTNSDEQFQWQTLTNAISKEPHDRVLKELLERYLFKRIFQRKIVFTGKMTTGQTQARKELFELFKKFEVSATTYHSNVVVVDYHVNNVFKDVDKSKIKIIKKTGDDYAIRSDWKNFNKELVILEHEVIMFRIYLRGKFDNRSMFNEKKAEILTYFKEQLDEFEDLQKKIAVEN
ncbi:HD domain-containing protein [Pedobacter antarcticus]|uniref:HD domain-containing protein n=1 Tax=Pedobacter antarcticus TaxID=34086 RepID=UPI0029307379|nr:HD domain-containing protein [Pedobacter antarcticus]